MESIREAWNWVSEGTTRVRGAFLVGMIWKATQRDVSQPLDMDHTDHPLPRIVNVTPVNDRRISHVYAYSSAQHLSLVAACTAIV